MIDQSPINTDRGDQEQPLPLVDAELLDPREYKQARGIFIRNKLIPKWRGKTMGKLGIILSK